MRIVIWLIVVAVCAILISLTVFRSKRPIPTTSNPSGEIMSLGDHPGPDSRSRSAAFPPATNSPKSSLAAQTEGTPTFATGDAFQRKAAANDLDLLAVKEMLRGYRATFGENPVGNNAEITKALLGGNARNAQFANPQAKTNKDNELVDRWNHPYFFHQLSRIDMEIRSAGPDGLLWTADDEVSP